MTDRTAGEYLQYLALAGFSVDFLPPWVAGNNLIMQGSMLFLFFSPFLPLVQSCIPPLAVSAGLCYLSFAPSIHLVVFISYLTLSNT